MALDDSEEEEEEEEEHEEEEGTDMESDLEQNKDDGNWAMSFIFPGFFFLSYKTINWHDGSLQISLMKWPGAPRRSCTMTLIMWHPVRIADVHRCY